MAISASSDASARASADLLVLKRINTLDEEVATTNANLPSLKRNCNSLAPRIRKLNMSASTEIVRSVIQQFANAVSARNFTALANLGAPEASYFVAGLQKKIPLAGDAPYTERVEQMQPILGGMDTFTFKVLGITVEGDTGVLEGEPIGEGPDGKSYRNNGLIKMVVKDGRIQSVREYIDFVALYQYLGLEL
ncbi:unnamed protein product [Cyclocybe aegerita]|uniref:SnoaL-like domain-containing protein n=1 Tax=Cyclocybe aegerita TaxID=1973307 RepID=A0A8S0XUM9_CYCAE|nr:unnamed protein product [Cyclocybe aegerita]